MNTYLQAFMRTCALTRARRALVTKDPIHTYIYEYNTCIHVCVNSFYACVCMYLCLSSCDVNNLFLKNIKESTLCIHTNVLHKHKLYTYRRVKQKFVTCKQMHHTNIHTFKYITLIALNKKKDYKKSNTHEIIYLIKQNYKHKKHDFAYCA